MEQPIINIGNGKWALKESLLLGYTIFDGFKDVDNYTPIPFSFTRATSGTLTNSQGLIEDSCYNLLQRSEEFDNAYWIKDDVTISANSTIAPNGSLTADKIVENTSNILHRVRSTSYIISTSTTYTLSLYLKAAERTKVVVNNSDGLTSLVATFDLTLATTNQPTYSTITSVGNGWYRCTVRRTMGVSVGNGSVQITILDTAGTTPYLGDGSSGVFVWGVQVEQNSTVRPYLKTTNRLNTPRTDYSLGYSALLLEPQRTNLFLHSENFSDVSWIKAKSTISANTNTNPFGVNKSYYLESDGTNGQHYLTQNVTTASGTSYSSSWYIKKADDSWVQILGGASTFGTEVWKNFNFDTGAFGNGGTDGTWTKRQLSNGWWMISFTAPSIFAGTSVAVSLLGTNNTNTAVRAVGYVGTLGRKICDVAATQFEAGANATTYIPATTAAVTRNADTSFYDMQSTNMFNSNNFTLYCEGFFNKTSGSPAITLILSDDSTTSGSNSLGFSSGFVGHFKIAGSSAGTGASLIDNSSYKTIMQYNNGSVKWFRNGVQLGATQAVPVFNYRYLVATTGNSTYNIKSLKLYDRTLSDAECLALTTL